MKNKAIAFILIITMLMQSTVLCFADDVSLDITEEATNAADILYELDLLKGTTEVVGGGTPTFELDREPSRYEAIVMFIRLLGKETEAFEGEWEHPFINIPEWVDKYVGYAYAKGLTNGVSENDFGGNQLITANEYLTLILRALGYKDEEDFVWNKSYVKTNEIGLTKNEYDDFSEKFLRADIAILSLNSLSIKTKDGSKTLCEIALGEKYEELFNSDGTLRKKGQSEENKESDKSVIPISPYVPYIPPAPVHHHSFDIAHGTVILEPCLTHAGIIQYKCVSCNYAYNVPINEYEDITDPYNPNTIDVCHNGTLVGIIVDNDVDVEICGEYLCDECGYRYYDAIDFEDIGIPVININGNLSGISKENKKTVSISYDGGLDNSFDCFATIKLQGAASVNYPKKNYSIQLFKENTLDNKKKVELQDGWGKESKYCLKANWVDITHSRNIGSAKLWGEIVRSREVPGKLGTLENGGAIDGYPVLLYFDGAFQGLYTLNIPKDNWMFDMDDDYPEKQAILFAEGVTNAIRMRSTISKSNLNGWEIEYCSTEDTEGTQWVIDSFNAMVTFINSQHTVEEARAQLSNYVDIESVMDYMIFIYLAKGWDNYVHNMILATYDGTHWLPSVYDLEWVWGLNNNNQLTDANGSGIDSVEVQLFKFVNTYFREELINRYAYLRGEILTHDNIVSSMNEIYSSLPRVALDAEAEKWTTLPSRNINTISQIDSWVTDRLAWFDNNLGVTSQMIEDAKQIPEEPEEVIATGYGITFVTDSGISIKVYETQDYSAEGVITTVAFSRDGDTGVKCNTGDGQLNFEIIIEEGYALDTAVNGNGIEIAAIESESQGYKKLKGPGDTEKDNTYRITKITNDLIVTIHSIEIESDEETINSYSVQFNVCSGTAVVVYNTKVCEEPGEITTVAFSRDGESGEETINEGQVNFKVIIPEGYTLSAENIVITSLGQEGQGYSNLKGPDVTEKDDTYRITKITDNLVVDLQIQEIPEHIE